MKVKNVLILCAVILLGTNCHDNLHHVIRFSNDSPKDIYVMDFSGYPDTTEFERSRHFEGNAGLCSISAYSVEKVLWQRSGFISYYERIPSDTLMIYVFDLEMLRSNGWNANETMLLQRYDLSLQDLQQLGYQLSYPPSRNMRYVKMYPLYGEEPDS
ncbi:hypothetical protein [Bacteroides sp.]